MGKVICMLLVCSLMLGSVSVFAYYEEWAENSEYYHEPEYEYQYEDDYKEEYEEEDELTIPIGAIIVPFCIVIASGNTVNAVGAPWRLYCDGTLIVEEGFINTVSSLSPWFAYKDDIERIIFTGPITAGTSLRGLFAGLDNMETIEGLDYFNTSNVANMSSMFQGASSLTSVDLSSWTTDNVMFMSWMFYDTGSLESVGDLSGWETGNVTVMHRMFWGASSLKSLDLSGWDTGNVTNMYSMFRDASSLTSVGDLSGWNTSQVTSMASMFRYASSLENLNLSGWDPGNVSYMSRMFSGASSLTSVGDLSGWDTGNVTAMNWMFEGASSLESLDLSGWDTSSVTNMYRMFAGASSLTCVGNLSGWDTSEVTTMGRMFNSASSLTSLDLSGWSPVNVTHMSQMFEGASSLTSLDLSGWDTSNVTTMLGMFAGATALRKLTLGENFGFIGSPALPAVPANATYTGHWQNIGAGTLTVPTGNYIFTSAQLMSMYDGTTMADTWVWRRTPFWGIGGINNHTFPTATIGYGTQLPHSVTVTNIGNQDTGNLMIVISGSNADAFAVSISSLADILVNSTASFTVVPNTGLGVGIFTATVTVSGASGIISAFQVTFEVTAAQVVLTPTATPTPIATPTPTMPPEPVPILAPSPNPMATPSPTPLILLSSPMVEITDEYEIHRAFMWGDNHHNFRPLAPITRAEAASVLVRTHVSEYIVGELPGQMNDFAVFADVGPNRWYFNYVAWAYYTGLITGDPACQDGIRRFRPGDPITRQEFAAITSRLTNVRNQGPAPFSDWNQVSNWARGYVSTAFYTGWMVGDGRGVFRPHANISRAEVATAINRILGRIDGWQAFANVDLYNPDNLRDYPDVGGTPWYVPSVIAASNNYRLRRNESGNITWMDIMPFEWDWE